MKLHIMRWFWGGFVVSIPVSFFILGNTAHIGWLVRQWSLLYFLVIAVAALIYRKRKGIAPTQSIFNNEMSLVAKTANFSMWFVAGHGIGFLTCSLFRDIF